MEISKYLKKKVLVVAHDSGAANQIYYLFKNHKKKFKTLIRGPALNIFKKNNYNSLKNAIQTSNTILTGTSWQSKLEVNAIKISKKLNKNIISFVDEPYNLKHRFILNKKFYFPNIILAKDSETLSACKKFFPKEVKIIKTKDHFLEYVKKNKIKPLSNDIVYLSSNYDGVSSKLKKKNLKMDLRLLKIFLKKINQKNSLKKKKIYLRLHPAEDINKYLKNSDFKKMNIKISKKKELLKCLNDFKYAFGCETYGLAIAKNYGLRAYNNVTNTSIKPKILRKYNIKNF